MPRRGNRKKYVKRADLRNNPGLPAEIGFVLDCAKHIRPKFLAVPTWLVAAGPIGLNLAELRALTGLGIISCENTLEALAEQGLAKEEPQVVAGEPNRWYTSIAYDQGIRIDKEKEEQERELIDPGGIYLTPLVSATFQLDCNNDTGKVEIEGGGCKRKDNNITGIEGDSATSKEKSLTIVDRPNSSGKVSQKKPRKKLRVKQPSDPPRKKLKVKRKKVVKKQTPRAALSDDLKAENKRRYGGRYRTYLKNPSDNPAVRDWEKKPRPNRWDSLDWVGYWLYQWFEYYAEEDPNFIDQTCYRTIARSRERTKGGLDIYWSTGLQMERFRDSTRTFKGSGVTLKEYIDWLFETFLPDNSWFDTPVSSSQVFRITNNFFLDKFKVRNVKKKAGKKKGKGKRYHWGYSYDD